MDFLLGHLDTTPTDKCGKDDMKHLICYLLYKELTITIQWFLKYLIRFAKLSTTGNIFIQPAWKLKTAHVHQIDSNTLLYYITQSLFPFNNICLVLKHL